MKNEAAARIYGGKKKCHSYTAMTRNIIYDH